MIEPRAVYILGTQNIEPEDAVSLFEQMGVDIIIDFAQPGLLQ